ncbi:MAG: hypothetical protein NTZ43_12850 [Gemmatimonadetes bacterium]|nr:hypothetical protein [Gemmatimonadota bacterium]
MSLHSRVAPLALTIAFALPLCAQAPRTAKAAAPVAAAAPATLASANPLLFSGLRYRMIGPARGGRVTAITGVPSQPRTFYMGSTGGGIWKTTDAGTNWQNISDGQLPVGSMGALEVTATDPNVIYAGTGSSKIRSNVSIGRGMYKSLDAGKTWSFSGLRDVGQIATVRVHPQNPDMVFAAALGSPFVPTRERGIYKSTDGGKNWRNVLFVTDSTGAADLEMQPGNPNVLFASMWHGMRRPWTIISGAREGGIYKSTDAGEHWTKLGGGLPSELFGRSNVAISAAAPNRIYALIEAKPAGGLYRSDDAGATWTLVNGAQNLWTRPFYYTTLQVDPKNPDVVYVGNEGWFKSTDGGKTFRSERVPHGDNHDLWINPNDSRVMIQSNDGGANVTLDGGATWSSQYNQPTAEIYQVATDNQFPYRVYGAQQDNTTLIVPSLPLGTGQAEEWRTGPGCETGPILPNSKNPNIVYGSCKGQFSRMNLTSGDEQQSWVGGESLYGNGGATLIYRFQRVSPMSLSPHDPKVLYYGSQYLHRTRDEGVTWEKVSPDLTAFPKGEPQEPSGIPITRDATGEEVYSTLYAIRESPVQKGVIWTGSNDGLVYVTRDDGKTWTNVTPKGLAAGGRVQNIDPSPHRAGTAYVAIYRFLLGDFAPYIYRTDDFGKSWTRLTDGTNGIAADEPTRVVREDPDRAKLLYAGTEFGMHVSFDDGAHWQKLQLNLPATPVTDIVVHAKDLVLSTQGRAFWVLDNLTPLHQMAEKMASAEAVLYAPRTATRMKIRASGGMGRGVGAQYPTAGAQIDYYLAKAADTDIKIEILDAAGTVVRTLSSAGAGAATAAADAGGDDEEAGPRRPSGPVRLDKSAGMHRLTWDLRYPGPWQSERVPEGGNGPMAVPGAYAVRLTVGAWSDTKKFTLIEDPRVTADGITTADLQAQFAHNMKLRDLVSDANRAVSRIRAGQTQFRTDAPMLQKVNALASQLITPPIRYSQPELATHITYLYSMTNGADQKVPKDAVERLGVLRKQLDALVQQINALLGPRM